MCLLILQYTNKKQRWPNLLKDEHDLATLKSSIDFNQEINLYASNSGQDLFSA